MEEKRPIDRKRDSGGVADIGTQEDGAIVEMIALEGRAIVVKTKSIYEMLLADDIDPERTNIDLPKSVHKLIINQGSESEIVCKTFLTAKTLFKPEYLDKSIDTQKLLKLSIEILEELIVLEREIEKYLREEKRLSEEYEKGQGKITSLPIPSMVNLETECKTIFQKADHVEQILMEIVTVFYPKEGLTKQSHFPMLHEKLKAKYGEKDPFTEFIQETLYFMKVVRGLRNGLDHRLKTVSVWNYEMQPDASILTPSIELKTKEETLDRVALSSFLPTTLKNMVIIIENSFAYLAQKSTASPNPLGFRVKDIPEDKRRNKHIRYCFWSPIGQGGFYQQ